MYPKSEEVEEKLSPNWLELPREITVSILEKLDAVDILENVQWVCSKWESICMEPSFWRIIVFRKLLYRSDHVGLYNLFKEAVNRSSGGLIDLQLIRCDSVILKYAAQRCTKIRRLRIVCSLITYEDLCEAAKMLPLLEDLEISCGRVSTAKGLQKLGECCPLLKSLKINKFRMWSNPSLDNDSEAMAIAENMVELRHLQLLENRLTNKGLKAILDNCSHLESLDLRQCPNLRLKDCSLGKRCTESIKDFRDPSGSFEYFDFDPIVYEIHEASCNHNIYK